MLWRSEGLAADDLAVDNALAILQVRQYYFTIERYIDVDYVLVIIS